MTKETNAMTTPATTITRRRLRAAEDDAQVGLEPSLNGFIQRQAHGLRRNLARSHAALEGVAALRSQPAGS